MIDDWDWLTIGREPLSMGLQYCRSTPPTLYCTDSASKGRQHTRWRHLHLPYFGFSISRSHTCINATQLFSVYTVALRYITCLFAQICWRSVQLHSEAFWSVTFDNRPWDSHGSFSHKSLTGTESSVQGKHKPSKFNLQLSSSWWVSDDTSPPPPDLMPSSITRLASWVASPNRLYFIQLDILQRLFWRV